MKTPLFSSLLLISLVFASLLCPCLSERCNPNDKKALFQIRKALNIPNHRPGMPTDCCDQYGVECDPTNNRITSLAIYNGNVSGQISSAVGDLPFLETLILRKLSNLSGPIPPAITKLIHLKMLWMNFNQLSGPVPAFLSQLKNLTYLNLNFNKLSGSIPSSLSTLQNLDVIFLDRNQLTGSIPDSFGRFTGKVPDLYLSHNQLSGKIPSSLGKLDFGTIDLSRNKLEGDASFLFGENKSTWGVILSRNLLEFDLTNVKFPKSLAQLDLSHNKIRGSLKAGLVSLELQLFNVSYNRLCGQIPTGGRLQNFEYTSYFHNRCLCGAPLPACK